MKKLKICYEGNIKNASEEFLAETKIIQQKIGITKLKKTLLKFKINYT